MDWLILADGESSSTINNGLTFLSVLAALITALFSWLTNRDRLMFDLEKNNLRTDNERLKTDVAKLQEETIKCHEDKESLTKDLNAERTEREDQYKALNERIRELRELAERKT